MDSLLQSIDYIHDGSGQWVSALPPFWPHLPRSHGIGLQRSVITVAEVGISRRCVVRPRSTMPNTSGTPSAASTFEFQDAPPPPRQFAEEEPIEVMEGATPEAFEESRAAGARWLMDWL